MFAHENNFHFAKANNYCLFLPGLLFCFGVGHPDCQSWFNYKKSPVFSISEFLTTKDIKRYHTCHRGCVVRIQ